MGVVCVAAVCLTCGHLFPPDTSPHNMQVQNALEMYFACDEENSPSDALSGFAAFTSPG